MAFSNPFRVDTANVPLMRAQLAAFTNQIPLLYFIVCVNAAALALGFRDEAPPWLTVGIPAALICVCAMRLVVWVLTRRKVLSDAAVARRLRGTVVFAGILGALFLGWGLALFPYGDDRAQDHVIFFVGITVVSCIFCLMHLRGAALLLTGVVILPFTLFLLATGDSTLVLIGVNLVLVALAMVHVLVVGSGNFAELVRSQLEAKGLAEDLESKVLERTHELELALDAAQEASRAKSLFLATMSHELRTPLNAVIGYSELLVEDAQQDGRTDQLPDLQRIHGAGKHLLALIDDVLDLSKIEAGGMQMEPSHVAVAPFLNEVVEMCRPLADKNGNTLTMTIADAITSVVADPMRLRQSLFNLLSNACKFTHQGTISLRADRDGEWLRLAVRDSGIGIAPEHLSKLFTNFTQASSGIAVRYGGTGLGLALSQRLCQLMGGRIEADSVLGEGSCFTIHLPLEPSASPARLAA